LDEFGGSGEVGRWGGGEVGRWGIFLNLGLTRGIVKFQDKYGQI